MSLCTEHYAHIKNAKKYTYRFYLEIEAFISVLYNSDKLTRSLGATRLFASRSLEKDPQHCSAYLGYLHMKLEPGKGRNTMSRYGLRALVDELLGGRNVPGESWVE